MLTSTVFELVSLAFLAAFYFGFGWYMSRVNRLWLTSEYGGKLYVTTLFKAVACGIFLGAAFLVAGWGEIPEHYRKSGLLFTAPLLLIGWVCEWAHNRRMVSRRNEDVHAR